MGYEALLDEAETDELGKQAYGTVAREATKAGEAIECERLGSLGEDLQQGLLAWSEGE